MKPIDQTIIDPNKGNCFSACLASIFEVDLESVPHLRDCKGHTVDEKADEFWGLIYKWLYDNFGKCFYYEDTYPENEYCIASGPSKRFPDRSHACVFFNGKVVHDPHPSRDGLDKIDGWWVFK